MKFRKYAVLSLVVMTVLIILFIVIPDVSKDLPERSTIVLSAADELLHCFLNDDEQWCLPFDDPIPSKLEVCVLNYEDRWFYYHPGFNPIALLRSFYLNLKYGHVVSGGSTITMQVARMAGSGKRSYWKKAIEILEAVKLELLYSKQEILRFYLGYAPYGGNIQGVRAAALKYFQKEPRSLTWSQAATLAVLPNAPGMISPGRNQEDLIKKRNKLLHYLYDHELISFQTLELSIMEPVPDIVFPLPQSAPHAALRLNTKDRKIIRSTIDQEIQKSAELIVKQSTQYLQNMGISNCAAIIAETKTGIIRAYCGSQDFYDNATKGQVDGIQAPRSSGSTLKPFLYALSMDSGLILPQTLMKDVPSYFGSFAPENADLKFNGMVTARDALVRSLNVPAVRLLYSYDYSRFHAFLRQAGLHTIFRTPDEYGLTLIIGGAETRLDELTSLYRGLAMNGNFSPLILDRDVSKPKSQSLISPAAAYLTLDMLKDLNRPGNEYYWHQYTNQWPLAWKTGTSFGQRDAWAIGVNPQWVIGVWSGNFTGEGNPSLSGAQSAGPILFDLFNALPKEGDVWFEMPLNDMDAVVICHETGFLAGKFCVERDTILVPFWKKPLAICPYHRQVMVNDDESNEVCSLCWEEGHYHSKIFTVYPPEVEKYLRNRGIFNKQIPPHKEGCEGLSSNYGVTIIYPTEGSRLRIPIDIDGCRQKVTFQAAHNESPITIYWYLDSVFIGTTNIKHEMSLSPVSGEHQLYVVDENGDDAQVWFSVD